MLCLRKRKAKATFSEHCSSAVWREAIGKNATPPTTPKPIKLLARIIKASTNPGDVVLDPCMGSGSTAMAIQRNKKKFYWLRFGRKVCYDSGVLGNWGTGEEDRKKLGKGC